MSEWFKFDEVKPESGDKAVFAYRDGCGATTLMAVDGDEDGKSVLLLDAEDASEVDPKWLTGSIWTKLPEDYELAFTTDTSEDWY